jgi:hypothetical protein
VYGVFFFVRYLYPLYFVAMVIVGFVVSDVVAMLRRRPLLIRRSVVAAGALYVSCLLYMTYNSGFRSMPTYPFYDVARWAAQNTSEDDVIGSFQSGAIGYLSGRKVVNLDGKVNSQALAALRSGNLSSYVAVSGVDLIIDHSKVISLFLGPWSEDDYRRVARDSDLDGPSLGAPGWVAYVPASVESRKARARVGSPPAMSRPPW